MKELPEGWRWVKLIDVAEIIMGQSPPGDTYNNISQGMPFLQGKAEFGPISPKHIKFTTKPLKKASKGSILISVRAPVGDVNIADIDYCIGRGLASISLNKGENSYLFYFLRCIKNKLKEEGAGSTFKAINKSILENLKIPIPFKNGKPDLEKQQKIVSILEKAEQTKRLQAEADELIDQFLKSTFFEMFGDPVKNPKGWELVKLGELCRIKRGASPRPIKNYLGGKVPWIKIGDGTKGNDLYIESTEEKIIEEGVSKSVLLKAGSLIFANCGVSLGFARILKIDGCIHDGWLSLEDIDQDLNKIFLLKLINSISEYLRKMAPEGTQPNLNTGIMKNFDIPLPPISLQNQFAQIVEKVEKMREYQNQSKEEIEGLFNALMQKAFTGELLA